MIRRYLIAALLLASVCSSQDVKVYHVDPELSVRAKKAWEAVQDANAAWEAIKEETYRRYLQPPNPLPPAELVHPRKFGAGLQFTFSYDFTVIIPAWAFNSGAHDWPILDKGGIP